MTCDADQAANKHVTMDIKFFFLFLFPFRFFILHILFRIGKIYMNVMCDLFRVNFLIQHLFRANGMPKIKKKLKNVFNNLTSDSNHFKNPREGQFFRDKFKSVLSHKYILSIKNQKHMLRAFFNVQQILMPFTKIYP